MSTVAHHWTSIGYQYYVSLVVVVCATRPCKEVIVFHCISGLSVV